MTDPHPTLPPRQVVVFRVGGTAYCLEIEAVDEITADLDVTPIPGAPGGVSGLIAPRGIPLPVFDLRWKFGEVVAPRPDYIVVHHPRGRVALAVDAVVDVVSPAQSDFQPLAPAVVRGGPGYVRGCVLIGGELVLWLDHRRLLPAAVVAAAQAA